MPSLFEIQTVARQFFRVESELSVLKAMVRELVLGNAPPVAAPPEPIERQPPQHFDGKRWAPGPTPETNVEGLDVPPGQG